MNLLAHPVAQGRIDQLVPGNPAFPGEGLAYNKRLKVLPVAVHLDMLTCQACGDSLLNGGWSNHC